MRGDFSRLTFNRKKNYTAVMMQQGRVQVDADWNEQQAINLHRMKTEAGDVIGPGGVPARGGGFKVALSPGGGDLTVSPGRIYVDGILCEAGETAVLSGQNFAARGAYLIYLDVWQRHITYLDDPLIRESALGGPDTTTRLQTVWQIKSLKLKSPADWAGQWQAQLPKTTGTMNVRLEPGQAYRPENQLYRIELHRQQPVTFKWSRDNGSVVTAIENFNGLEITVSEIGRDDYGGFQPGQWVEIIDDARELGREPGQLLQIDRVEAATRVITLKTRPESVARKLRPKLRRWDSPGEVTARFDWMPLEGGIQIKFSPGTYTTGDYWLIPARSGNGDIQWPPYESPNLNPEPQPPLGNAHHYCPLALVEKGDSGLRVEDIRQMFPPLTGLTASDVSYRGNSLLPGAGTVQEALDALCQSHQGCYTATVGPGQDLEKFLNQLTDQQHIQICLQGGAYKLKQKVTLKNKETVKISGCGPGTQISAAAEAALYFENCKSVVIEDLMVESQTTVPGHRLGDNLNGALTFINCASVKVEGAAVGCAPGLARAATCITVRNGAQQAAASSVRIHCCDLAIGHQQVGILVVNAGRAQIEDNTLQVKARNQNLTLPQLAQNPATRSDLLSLLVSNVNLAKKTKITNAMVQYGGHKIYFRTDKSLTTKWQQLINANPPARANSPLDLYHHVKNTATRFLLNKGAGLKAAEPLQSWYLGLEQSTPAVASQGIVCGGMAAHEVRIVNNTIRGVLQGIHIGLSHREPKPGQPYLAGRVWVTGNAINIYLPLFTKRERHGVFVGNCENLIIEGNNVKAERFSQQNSITIEGIRVYGHLGRLMAVRQNYLEDCTTGIHAWPLAIKSHSKQWLIIDNMAPGAKQAVLAPAAIRNSDNYK